MTIVLDTLAILIVRNFKITKNSLHTFLVKYQLFFDISSNNGIKILYEISTTAVYNLM
jgi:hypothetical protein